MTWNGWRKHNCSWRTHPIWELCAGPICPTEQLYGWSLFETVMEFLSGEEMELKLYFEFCCSSRSPFLEGSWRGQRPDMQTPLNSEVGEGWHIEGETSQWCPEPAEVGTKRVSARRLRLLMCLLGISNADVDCLEGSWRLVCWRTGVRLKLLRAIIGVLALD